MSVAGLHGHSIHLHTFSGTDELILNLTCSCESSCMCNVSLHYNVSILQEFLAMQRVVSLARLLHNLGAEKQSGHMSQVTVAQVRETIQ